MISLSYLFPKVGLTLLIQTGYQTLYIERYVEMNLFVKPVFLILYKQIKLRKELINGTKRLTQSSLTEI